MLEELKGLKRAALYSNDDFIFVQTYSGYRTSAVDLNGETIFLPIEVNADELGGAILAALAVSRVISVEEIESYRDLERLKKVSLEWRRKIIQKYEYKTETRIFRNMKYCSIRSVNENIEFSPTIHKKKDSWVGTGLKGADHVIVTEKDSVGAIGRAALLALTRSTG